MAKSESAGLRLRSTPCLVLRLANMRRHALRFEQISHAAIIDRKIDFLVQGDTIDYYRFGMQ